MYLELYRRLLKGVRGWPWPAGARYPVAWHLASAITGFLLATLLVLAEPFDLDRGIGERGRSAFYKIASFAYPRDDSDKLLVVELDERFLASEQESWPAPYAMHIAALDQINSYGPRAIFIDFVFIDPRPDPDLDLLIDTLERIADDTPLYVAAAPFSASSRAARDEIMRLVDRNDRITLVSVVAPDDPPGAYQIARDEDGRLPAAVQLYSDLCRTGATCGVRAGYPAMDIWWGASTCVPADDAACASLPDGPIERALSLVVSGVSGGALAPSWAADPLPAAYPPTVTLTDIHTGARHAEIRALAEDGVVFYGGDLAFVGDMVESPVHGMLSGVHAHAMAYDNLHALEGRYIRAEPPGGFKLHVIVLCFVLSLASFAVRAYFTLRRPKRRLQPHYQTGYFGSLDALVFFVGALLIAAFDFALLGVGPSAWAPVLAATAAGDFLSRRPLTGRFAVDIVLGRQRSARAWRLRLKPRSRR